MARKPVQWGRIYRQTLTLIHKNFLLFYTAPISTAFRALIFPIVAALVLCFLKNISDYSVSSDDAGFATTARPIPDLAVAMNAVGRSKVAFVSNGTSSDIFNPIVEGIRRLKGMDSMSVVIANQPDELFDICKQSLVERSDCYAAVVFSSFNETNVEYSLAIDGDFTRNSWWGNWREDNDILRNLIFPLQWAVDAQIGGFPDAPSPSTHIYRGSFGPNYDPFGRGYRDGPVVDQGPVFWLSIVVTFLGPVFILLLIGVVYQLAVFVATERETSMAELMGSQQVTIMPRILSTFLSFFALYFPGFLASSIILTQVLFLKTSDILMILLTLLAGASLITSSHFVASFFARANLAGLYTSTMAFALGLVTLAAQLSYKPTVEQSTALAAIFPPITWVTLIQDIALRESHAVAFSLLPIPKKPNTSKAQIVDGYLYLVFLLAQIIIYSVGTYFVESRRWGVERKYDLIEASSDVAVRCTGLTKTYPSKKRRGTPVMAVDNLNLEVKKGSVTFLLGPNGGGKTTTLKCVAGMISMDAGSKLELNEDGVVFGICPQNNVFWRGLTVKQHIEIWRKLKTAASATVDDDDVIAECDLLEKIDAPAHTLSGGQMRKLQLAISFAGGSKVCCIDEASSGLDPLSRRNIWNIIQKGHSRRTILVTTHFLDEADVLADHIAIMYKGKLVCEGPGTTLKARYGEDYLIRSSQDTDNQDDSMVWRTSNSAEATRKLLELESLDNDTTYSVEFPTLEQVFLKVTTDTAIHAQGGDGFVGEIETETVLEEKIFAMEADNQADLDLDVGAGIGFFRQVMALFSKRYILLRQKSGWISYGINLVIPLIVAVAIGSQLRRYEPLVTCEKTIQNLRFPDPNTQYPVYGPATVFSIPSRPYLSLVPDIPLAILGPSAQWSTEAQEDLFLDTLLPYINAYTILSVDPNSGFNASDLRIVEQTLESLQYVPDLSGMVDKITNYSGYGYYGFGVFAPTPETATIFYNSDNNYYQAVENLPVLTLVTNKIANATAGSKNARLVETSLLQMRAPVNVVDFRQLPTGVLVVFALIASASIAGLYPAYEKIHNVRALQYCNGVTPAALWLAYLLFDAQFIILESIILWAAMYSGQNSDLYYESGYLLGIFILFGLATYLGTYVLSLFIRKAVFAVSAGIHIVVFVLYLVAYVVTEAVGEPDSRWATFSALQYGFGLVIPANNVARALWVANNVFATLCGKYSDADVSSPMALVRYGSPYLNLIVQILFLIGVLALYEYGSKDFIRRHITQRGVPSRLHYIVEAGGETIAAPPSEAEKNASANIHARREILQVQSISKYFGKNFAVENVSFNISPNETLALLGGNGAGKTTVINMIRGEITPNFGDIFLDGTSVLQRRQKARLQMGVCPQDDAVDNLTVRQTLRFYATVKGLKNVEGNVDKVLNALNISMYEDHRVAALSGGTKRKLSVAIALLGNPRILLLDEPSTGQDAGAKRILWRALKDISANRAILLTTHSMEEAESLATNVAIMGTKMLATGTLATLQESHGGAYMIRAVREPGTHAGEVESIVKREFENMVSNYEDSHGQVSFGLPHDKAALGSIMRVMEMLKGGVVVEEGSGAAGGAGGSSSAAGAAGGSSSQAIGEGKKVFSDYTINSPTLEEIFMNVARESGVAGGV